MLRVFLLTRLMNTIELLLPACPVGRRRTLVQLFFTERAAGTRTASLLRYSTPAGLFNQSFRSPDFIRGYSHSTPAYRQAGLQGCVCFFILPGVAPRAIAMSPLQGCKHSFVFSHPKSQLPGRCLTSSPVGVSFLPGSVSSPTGTT